MSNYEASSGNGQSTSTIFNGRSAIETALELMRRFELWPVPIKPGGKAPIGVAWGVKRPTEQSIRAAFERYPGAGVGLKLGPEGGIIDIECDGPEGESSLIKLLGGEIISTLGWSSTRGPHLLFRYDDRLARHGKSISKLPDLPGLEIRIGASDKQFQSNCPPTIGTDGKPREWNGCWTIADLPEAAFSFLDRPVSERTAFQNDRLLKSRQQRPAAPTNVEERARKYAQAIEPAISGQGGHDRTFYAACKIGPGFDLNRELALRILSDEYNPRCDPPWSAKDLEHKLDDAYEKSPDRGWLLNSEHQDGGKVRQTREWTPATGRPIVTKSDAWVSCQHNSKIWLTQQGLSGKVRHDQFRQTLLVDGNPIDDETVIRLTGEIEKTKSVRWNQEHVRSALIDIGRENQFSSLTEWLDSLKWDGASRVNTFFNDAYGVACDAFSIECAKVLFLSAVARAYQPGCQADVMVVMIGPQGLGKSMGIAALCHNPDWYADDLGCDIFDRKAGEGLQGKWLFEFSEFTRINRATMDAAKSFISRRVDRYRPAYGRFAKDFPRTCVFVGTTNDECPLRDSENRRFLPISVVQADIDWIKANRDQLWAEAVTRYRDGEPWWTTEPDLVLTCLERQASACAEDAWESILAKELTGYAKIDMKEAALKLDIGPDRLDRQSQNRIGVALKAIGFKKRRVRDGSVRTYIYERVIVPT